MKWKACTNPISVVSLVLAMVLVLLGVGCSFTPSPASNTYSSSSLADISLTSSEPYVGNVMTYDYDPNMGGTITIQDRSGNPIPFQINAGDFEIMPSGATVAAGEWVTVISYREAPNTQLMAVGLYVYLQSPPLFSNEHARWCEEQRAERYIERTVPERWK